MAQHNESGKEGEQLAHDYLVENQYTILHRNWRYSRYEVDIIALKEQVLHFVEVKLRSSKIFGPPEEHVNKKKYRDICRAAEEFLFQHPQYRYARIDILSVTKVPGAEPEIFFIEDVFL